MVERTMPRVRKARLPYIDRSLEMTWIAGHEREYAGQWVVLDGDRLIGHGNDPLPIVQRARIEGIERPLIVHVKKEFGPSMGGWL